MRMCLLKRQAYSFFTDISYLALLIRGRSRFFKDRSAIRYRFVD
jgi:hypothetical protein